MLVLHIDPSSNFDVRIPQTSAGLLALAAAYIARESALDPAERRPVPSLEPVRTALERASLAVREAEVREADRAEFSAVREKAVADARPLLDKAINRLKVVHEDNLAVLERWGLKTKSAKNGKISVSKPKKNVEWAELLARYVQREQAQPEAARLTVPSLEALAALDLAARTGKISRDEGKDGRTVANQKKNEALDELADYLRLAAAVLVVERYGRKISRELAMWGFEVVERQSDKQEEAPKAAAV